MYIVLFFFAQIIDESNYVKKIHSMYTSQLELNIKIL